MTFDLPRSKVMIQLLKGPLYRETSPTAWRDLTDGESEITDYFSHIGLSLFVHQDFGFAFLKQEVSLNAADEESVLPRLIQQRELSFELSVLLTLLRKKMVEHDSASGDPRLVLDEREILNMLKVFLRETNNDVKQKKEVDALIEKTIDIGVMRRMSHDPRKLEVLRVLAAIFDAARLSELDQKLEEYENHARSST